MSSSAPFLNASEAASRLGVSVKALRLYERRGLIAPLRTKAGWRTYGPHEMRRADEIIALRALGLSLGQVARVLTGDSADLGPVLAAHQAVLDGRMRQLAAAMEKIALLRSELARGIAPLAQERAQPAPDTSMRVTFNLPWPWGGERFDLGPVRALNYIIGPLGSGKTRLGQRLAETLPGAVFLGLDRRMDGMTAEVCMTADAALRLRVDRALASLAADGATPSGALIALLAGLEAEGPSFIVVDMIEQGLDRATQQALIAHLRRRGPARPLFLLTRSCEILDLAAVGADEAIILCPANHSPPRRVAPFPGSPGYEAVATCLASPEVRARTEGVIAWGPDQPAA